jgi:hypothetical protein
MPVSGGLYKPYSIEPGRSTTVRSWVSLPCAGGRTTDSGGVGVAPRHRARGWLREVQGRGMSPTARSTASASHYPQPGWVSFRKNNLDVGGHWPPALTAADCDQSTHAGAD